MKAARTIIAVLILSLAAFSPTSFARSAEGPANDQSPQAGVVVRPHSPVIGPVNAPVTIIEFFDPACEACRAMHPEVKRILRENADARLVLRYTPFHGKTSVLGINILEAARQQNRFAAVLEALMDAQPAWASHGREDSAIAWEFARKAGLDVAKARAYIATGVVEKVIAVDLADAKAAKIGGTPSFFVNGTPLPRLDPALLSQLVRTEVKAKR
ncbi:MULTISPECIES: thioredoxin domain-containing protein [unclassified Stenotrophomonas]|uniref:DsbA family protein n=1 Tax=unclassified Stenotrophomonas TaxID=196198 RepID=UPI0012FE89F4|nr:MULTISPECIES: thioredoxin domain-containing protein [unclassified Stenotrophomonas]